jgi:hypothetical protein
LPGSSEFDRLVWAGQGRVIRRQAVPVDLEALSPLRPRRSRQRAAGPQSSPSARNYSILITPGDVRLAPLYDLNATLGFGDAGQANQMAMRVGGEGRFERISSGNWRPFAGELQLSEEWVIDQVRTMAGHLPEALTAVCLTPDLVDIADATLQRTRERVALWCRTARAAS